MSHDPTTLTPTRNRLVSGLSKISLALKNQSWKAAGERGLTPTQGQILASLLSGALKPSEIAEQLGVKLPTVSDSVKALEDKSLVQRERDSSDARSVRISLTAAGQQQAQQVSEWPDFLLSTVEVLSEAEQAALLRSLVKMVYTLQQRGLIIPSRMCVSCSFFRPDAYPAQPQPHHCAFVDKPFGDAHLQLDCPDHQATEPGQVAQNWARFLEAAQ